MLNAAPVAVNDGTYNFHPTPTQTTLDISAANGVLNNDTDADLDTLTAVKDTDPSHGSAMLYSDGSFSYMPMTGYVGSDSFTCHANDMFLDSNTATVYLYVTNMAPVASNDVYNVHHDEYLSISAGQGLLDNDADADNDTLTAVLVSDVSHGMLMLSSDGSFDYQPEMGYAGADSFTYQGNDGIADSSTAIVTLHVTNTAPTASNESYQVDQDDTLSVAAVNGVLANDTDADGDTLAATIIDYPTHAYYFALSSDGSFTYSPDSEFEGTDRFSYYANDGVSDSAIATVRINVTNFTPGPAGPAVLTPDAVRQNQEQVNGSFYSIALASGELTAAHALPIYNGNETVQLVYDSESVAPNPIFLVRHTLSDTAVPDSVGATLTLDGVTGTEVFFDTSSLNAEDTVQIALQADATGLPTGRYAYQVDVTAYFSTPTTDSYIGYVDIINNADSAFGAGWSVQGLDRLWPVSGGAILEMAGGVSMWFADGATTGTFVSPAGDFSTLTENIDGTFTRVAADGMTTQFDSSGRQTAVIDRNGNATAFEYDMGGALVSITDPFESEFTFDYDGGQVVQITDPAGRSTELGYDGSLLVTITDPDPDGEGSLSSPVISLAYDTAGRLTDWTDPNSNTTTFSYNFAGRVETITRPDDSEEQVTAAQMIGLVAPGDGTALDPAVAVLGGPMLATYTDANENTWTTQLDDLGFGLATQETDPLGDTTAIVRDANGLPTDIIDPLQRETSYVYDSQGNATTITMPDGAVYTYEFNGFGEVTQVTEPDPDGEGGRLGSITQYVYDTAGNLAQEILPDDDTDPDNNPTYLYEYDAIGLLTSATDPRSFTTTYYYDEQGRLIQILYPDDDPTMSYDDAGNLASVTNELGFTTAYAYDNLGRLTQITQPDDDSDPDNNPQTTLAYDAAGNLTAQTNPLGQTTSFTINAMNQPVAMTGPDPDGSGPQAAAITAYGYDPVGNLTATTDPIGRVSASVYDAANRLTQTSVNGNHQTDYGYDAASQLISVSSPAPVAASPANRLITSYAYDSRGQRSSISDNTGRLQTFNYNPAGELLGFT